MLKIILADNQAIFRTGAAKVLAVEDDLRIVAQAENSEKMMMALEKFHASVLILSSDIHSNLQAVVESARKFKTKLVVIAMAANGYSIADPNDALQMDVVGFDASVPEVVMKFVKNHSS